METHTPSWFAPPAGSVERTPPGPLARPPLDSDAPGPEAPAAAEEAPGLEEAPAAETLGPQDLADPEVPAWEPAADPTWAGEDTSAPVAEEEPAWADAFWDVPRHGDEDEAREPAWADPAPDREVEADATARESAATVPAEGDAAERFGGVFCSDEAPRSYVREFVVQGPDLSGVEQAFFAALEEPVEPEGTTGEVREEGSQGAEARGAVPDGVPCRIVRARPASLGARGLAWIVDGALLVGASVALVVASGRILGVSAGPERLAHDPSAALALTTAVAVLGAVYTALSTWLGGQTVGARLVGVKVLDGTGHPPALGRATLRGLLASLGTLLGLVGLVWVVSDDRGQALHDKLTRTFVVEA